jgi:monoamine oxidase
VRQALQDIEVGGGADDPAIDPDWGEPGLSPAERVIGWNSLEVLAMTAGNPAQPVGAIPGSARMFCQLRFVVGTRLQDVVPALRAHLDAHGFGAVELHVGAQGEATRLDPDDPWRHPDAAALDAISFADWLRAQRARPPVLRLHELGALALAAGSTERLSLLGQLRMIGAAGAEEVYGYERWEGLRLAAGSAALPLRMAADLGDRVRYGARVTAIDVAATVSRGTLETGEELRAEAVICALPVGPLRGIAVSGVSDARLASLHRQRQALAAKVVAAYPAPIWRDAGASGLSDGEGLVSSTWPQGNDALSMLVAPERLAHFLAAPPAARCADVLACLARLYGDAAREPDALLERAWGVDPLTQGYVAQWAPGDLTAVGPLHGTHEPPFYLCGSDHWVAGYMEGAVRTGRAAAAAALGAAAIS